MKKALNNTGKPRIEDASHKYDIGSSALGIL